MSDLRKKKILYVITKGNFGGAQRYVYDLATMLPKDKFTVAVAHGEGNLLPAKLNRARIKTIPIKSLSRDIKITKDIKVFFELLQICKNEQPNIVHLNSSKIGILGALAVRIHNLLKPKASRLKAIFTAHGWPFKEKRNWIFKLALKIASWLTVLLVHQTIVVSEDDFEKSKKFPWCAKKITIIHNGIGNISFKNGFQARQFLGNDISEGIWIGTISELHPNKGLDILIKSFKEIAEQYTDTALIIIGEGQERQNLQKLIVELNLEKKVHMIGHIDNAPQYLKAFDLFLLTSRKEGLPYVILEAGKAELPIVASNIGGIPEIIMDHKTGLLAEVGNIKSISIAIKEVILNKNIYGAELKKTIQEHFSIEEMLENTIKLY